VTGWFPTVVARAPGRIPALLIGVCLAAAPACAEPRSVELVISKGELPQEQRLIAVSQGDELTLRLTSDRPLEVHLHGYEVEQTLSPGAVASLHITARATGRFPIEVHGDTGGDAKVIGYLEVRPR
jgi:hypothetical protein